MYQVEDRTGWMVFKPGALFLLLFVLYDYDPAGTAHWLA